MIWILLLLAVYVISFWIYGYQIHKVSCQRDDLLDLADDLQYQLDQVPASVRDHYRRKA